MPAPFRNQKLILLLGSIFLVYVLFPSNNSSNDAYYSAAELKYQWNIFEPHHLLHNALLYVLSYPVHWFFPKVDHLALAKIWSAFFSCLSLGVLYSILKQLHPQKKNIFLYISLVAFSFGVWRFSTESEYYIVPILFSLLGSLYFLKFLQQAKLLFLFLSGFFAAFACVLHQVHVFWWLGLLIGVLIYCRSLKAFLYYALPALLVPLSYTLVVLHLEGFITVSNVIHFMFYAYATDVAPVEFGIRNFFFFAVAIWRTFLQLFPTILLLLKKSYLFYIPIIALLTFLVFIIKQLFNKDLFHQEKKPVPFPVFGRIHFLILLFHLGFALFSMGNSEFMVMVPYLLAILFFLFYEIPKKNLMVTLALLIIWNIIYGIYPLYSYQMTDAPQMIKTIKKKQDAFFIVRNYDTWNIYAYKYGVDEYEKIIPDDQITREEIDSLLLQNVEVYTNSINAPEVINRRSFSGDTLQSDLFKGYKQTKTDSMATFYGYYYLYKLDLKE